MNQARAQRLIEIGFEWAVRTLSDVFLSIDYYQMTFFIIKIIARSRFFYFVIIIYFRHVCVSLFLEMSSLTVILWFIIFITFS